MIDKTPAANEPRRDSADKTSLVVQSDGVPQDSGEPNQNEMGIGAAGDGGPADEPVVSESSDGQEAVTTNSNAAESQHADDDTDYDDAEDEDIEDDEEEEEVDMDVEPLEQLDESAADDVAKDWYILKVQSNREESIRDALQRRVAVEGLGDYFGEIIVPTEDVAEFKNGKKRITKRKLFPGYIVVHMTINDDTWFLVRETPGIGDFTGSAGRPSPMLSHEVERIVQASKLEEDGGEPVKTAIPFKIDDRVRIKEGTFENFEGEVSRIDEANGQVTVMINIFGRSTPVELEHWQVESL